MTRKSVLSFANSTKAKYIFTQLLAVIAIPPASIFELEQCYGGRSNPRAYVAFNLRIASPGIEGRTTTLFPTQSA